MKTKDNPLVKHRSIDTICFQSMLINMPQCIFWKNTDCSYLGCNEKFAKLVGLNSTQEIVGLSDHDLPWHDLASIYIEEDKQILAGKKIVETEIPLVLGDNELSIISVVKVPMIENNQIVGILGIFSDITERVKTERELILEKQKFEAANKAKSEFIANITHDLKTPLNAIIGMAEIIKSNLYPHRLNEFINDIVNSAQDLLVLIDDVLSYSKNEFSLDKLKIEKFDLKFLLEQLVEVTYQQAQAKGVSLNLEYTDEVPSILYSSPMVIKRIITNLVGNALKFTEKGNITIAVNKIIKSNEKFWLQIAVEDSGIGIPPDKLDEIFERFKQIESLPGKQQRGTGLGLAIVKNLVHRLGGEIYVNSALGKGATFFCNLPFQLCEDPRRKSLWLEKYSDLCTLIIDNNEGRARVMSHYLGQMNTFILTPPQVHDEFPDFCKNHDEVQIIIIDSEINLEERNIIINKMACFFDINKILFILSGEDELNKEGNRLFFDKLTKPIRPTIFTNYMANCWERWNSKLFDNPSQLQENRAGTQSGYAKVLLVEDEPIAQKFCKLMINEIGYQVDIADTGFEAIKLFEQGGYSFVITDIGLPDMNGFEVIKAIRASNGYSQKTKIVVLSGHLFEDDIKTQYGINEIITKPASKNELRKVLS